MKWIKIEDGCEMPCIGDDSILVTVNFGSNKDFHLVAYDSYGFNFLDDVAWQIDASCGRVTQEIRIR